MPCSGLNVGSVKPKTLLFYVNLEREAMLHRPPVNSQHTVYSWVPLYPTLHYVSYEKMPILLA